MLGNFNHASTVDSARLLLGAPLASEPGVSYAEAAADLNRGPAVAAQPGASRSTIRRH